MVGMQPSLVLKIKSRRVVIRIQNFSLQESHVVDPNFVLDPKLFTSRKLCCGSKSLSFIPLSVRLDPDPQHWEISHRLSSKFKKGKQLRCVTEMPP